MKQAIPPRRAALVVLICAALLHTWLYPALFAGSNSYAAISFFAIPSVLAAAVALWRARQATGHDRWGWLALAFAFALTAVLDASWSVAGKFGADPGYPSWWDAPYIASYPVFIAGVGLVTSPLWRGEDRRWLFDAGALLAVAAGLGLHFVLPRTSDGFVETTVGLAYLLLDLAFLGTVLSGVYRARLTLSNALLLLGAATLAAGDIAFYFHELTYDSTWTAGTWLMAIAAVVPASVHVRIPPLRIVRSSALPYALVVVFGAVTAVEMRRGSADDLLVASVVALGLVVGRQILSLRVALNAQRAETAFREAVLDTQSDLGIGMLILEHGRVVFANGAAERISGLSSTELAALPSVESLAFEHEKDEWSAWLAAPLAPEETRIARPDGVVTEIEVVARRLEGPADSRVLIVARDITARKEAAEALAHAQKFESLGALAGGVAHDFNNLLSSVLGNVGLMRMGELDAEAAESVDSIEAAALRGAELTRRLLDFARPQSPAFQVEDLRGCLEETAALARPALPANVALHLAAGPSAAPVRANRGLLIQAFLNLVINARDAVGESGVITLRLATRDDVAVIEVSDTGDGMDEATRNRIFEPFFTTKSAGAGTGLGLTISQRTIRDHRGDLGVVSEPGFGTTFTVTLPLARLPRAS